MSFRRVVVFFLLIPLLPIGSQTTGITRAGWLAGCWELRAPNRVTLEMWMPASGDVMLGASRTTVGNATSEFEQLRMNAEGERIIYTSIPSGQREASFPSIQVSDTALVFENMAHDFPQRISFRRRGADSVIAQIEGPGANGPRRISFPMRRASCTTIAPPAPPDAILGTRLVVRETSARLDSPWRVFRGSEHIGPRRALRIQEEPHQARNGSALDVGDQRLA